MEFYPLVNSVRLNSPVEMVARYLERANINEQDEYGYTSLFEACYSNNTDIISLLLRHPLIKVNLQKMGGYTPMHTVCFNGNNEALRMLLQDPRVDINICDESGWSPLMCACFLAKTESVKLLLAFGRYVDVDKKTTAGCFALPPRIDAMYMAKNEAPNTTIAAILKEFKSDPVRTRLELRQKMGMGV